MQVAEIIRAALAAADRQGVRGVKPHHLSESQMQELLGYCLDWLWSHPKGPSDVADGWLVAQPGIRSWWDAEAQLTDDESRRIRPLRTQVYDLLEDFQLIRKGVGHNVPIHVAPPTTRTAHFGPPAAEQITVTAGGAGYGDPVANAQVEKSAMQEVADEYRTAGWTVQDVSARNCGWDLTASHDGQERHVEVKGVSGPRPHFLLTRNEFHVASRDPLWQLAIVTNALTSPTLTEYDAGQVLAAADAHVYRVRLTAVAHGLQLDTESIAD